MYAPTARAPAARSGGECSTSARCEPASLRVAASSARRAAPPPPSKALRRSGAVRGCGRVGRSRAVATMTPRRAESPASASPSRAPPQELLYAGACAVEETALSSALGTVVAHDSGTLKSRRLRYEACSPETLEQAYDRCGIVTEDYGRTFYMGARSPGAGDAAAGAARAARRREKAPSACFADAGCTPSRRSRRSRAAPRRRAATQLMTEQRRKAIWAIYGAFSEL